MSRVFLSLFISLLVSCKTWETSTIDTRSKRGFKRAQFSNLPRIGKTPGGDTIYLGGFSGLHYLGRDEATGELKFITHTDRGPNLKKMDVDGDGFMERTFVLPQYRLRILELRASPDGSKVRIHRQIELQTRLGPLTGLPNFPRKSKKNLLDEVAIDIMGKVLPPAPHGLDLEAIALRSNGDFVMGDEYRPSIAVFNSKGVMVNRYIPQGDKIQGAKSILPDHFRKRRRNGGFEALAFKGDTVYAFMQTPFEKSSKVIRVLALDLSGETVVAEYAYQMDFPGKLRIGGATHVGGHRFWVIERDEKKGAKAYKRIYEVDFERATNRLKERNAVVVVAEKKLLVDLAARGLADLEKYEGIARIDDETLALINDNDFGLSGGFDPVKGKLDKAPTQEMSFLTIVNL